MQHHSQRLSRAAVIGDAAAIRKKIAALKSQAGLSSSSSLSVVLI
jgi:hypothetical protein